MFPLANPQHAPIVYCVPKSNPDNILILLYICSANLKPFVHFHKKPGNF